MEKKKIYLSIIILIILFSISLFLFKSFFSDIQEIKNFILNFGILSPIIFILLHILQVIIAPIPGQFFGFIGGYLFGVWKGTFYSLTGTVLGTLLVVFLVRKFGEPFIRKIIDKKIYDKFDDFCEKRGALGLFLFYLLPFFPDDVISIIAGLSKLKIRQIVLLAFIGRLPGMFGLSLIGAGIAQSKANIATLIVGVFIFIFFIIYLYRNKLENKMIKLIKKLKHNK